MTTAVYFVAGILGLLILSVVMGMAVVWRWNQREQRELYRHNDER